MKIFLNLFITAVVLVVAFVNILLAETAFGISFGSYDHMRDWVLIQLSLVAIFLLLQSNK
jgi:hypothetical protein